MTARKPEVFVLAGPNGAGKPTVASVLLPKELRLTNFVNADLIAQALSPYSPEVSAFDAGRSMLRRIRELRDRRQTFGFESTLASKAFAPFLRDAKDAGYVVQIVYVALRDADLAVSRVRLRVARGGHDIPEATIRRRFARSLSNFFGLYRPLAGAWSLWDNSGEAPCLVARGGAGESTKVLYVRWWDLYKQEGSLDGC